VEKSLDGRNFQFVARVNGARNSSVPKQYAAIDLHPFSGVSYYRLKQTHFDGSVSYSKLAQVFVGSERRCTIFPNPVNDGVILVSIAGYQGESMGMELTDMNGKTVHTFQKMEMPQGQSNLRLKIPGSVAPGVYILRIQGTAINQSERIVIE
jgi:hypothetical protein